MECGLQLVILHIYIGRYSSLHKYRTILGFSAATSIGCFFSCLTGKHWSSALPVLCHTPCVGEDEQLMLGTRQMITQIITFRKSNKYTLDHWDSTYWSSRKETPYTKILIV